LQGLAPATRQRYDTLAKLSDGRWIVLGQLKNLDGAASPLGPFGWLVGPKTWHVSEAVKSSISRPHCVFFLSLRPRTGRSNSASFGRAAVRSRGLP
jgi:hypothetical protein